MYTAVPERPARAIDPGVRSFGRLAAFAAGYTYALIVVGGIVRITGSGLGCGDDWPRCHGNWIPPMTVGTLIEYTHRLLAAGVIVVVTAVLVRALRLRARPEPGGAGRLVQPAALAAGLLVLQVVLGGVTVLLSLSPAVTVLHLGTAMALFATLLVAAIRGGALGGEGASAHELPSRDETSSVARQGARRVATMALAGAALAYATVLLGALVANTQAPASGAPSAAALACQGFPLCNGKLLPEGGLVHIQFTHRILAYLLFLHALGAFVVLRRRVPGGPVRTAGQVAVALVVTQVVVGAGMVMMALPRDMRGLHLLVGAGVWGAMVVWTTLARSVSSSDGVVAGVREARS